MPFAKELDFEEALCKELSRHGWEKEVLLNPTESDLIANWRNILFENNRGRYNLNNVPLSDGEMFQIMEQVQSLRTPYRLNSFINGKIINIVRDNKKDKDNYQKTISLKIFDRHEIAAGQSRYQIARQPQFRTKSKILGQRRGDIMLLINGMPVFHIELKRSGIPVSQAWNQIERYAHEGVYSGIFSLVQVFVAMNPEEIVYFANPGPDGTFNPDFYFHWADFNNEPINDWKEIAAKFLYIPMAHQLIGFYTVPDSGDQALKVMRSYQYYAANAISDRVAKLRGHWDEVQQRGGYVWHTTGSGKTMTSFKAAQLIAASGDADKVIFLMDRIELGTQSLKEFRNFADEAESVQGTANTGALIKKMKSIDPSDTLIVTSIQKMSNIKEDGLKDAELKAMQSKRIVFVVDECHRSVFGEMLFTVKSTFPKAMFFGFTGTPILPENMKKDSTTSSIFGNELHRYSVADGIRDENVLGFDPHKVLTWRDYDLRKAVALEKAKAASVEEALSDEKKKQIYYKYINMPMGGSYTADQAYKTGIEDYVSNAQYDNETHHEMVVKDILNWWLTLSRNGKFHAILATSSIKEAIAYYELFKTKNSKLKITALFDSNIDNTGGSIKKEDALKTLIEDYNALYGQNFSLPEFPKMKKDIASRLAHKTPYVHLEKSPEKQIDLLIVVDQMLTGFDSKWVNTLYIDKMLEYERLIQAFSRTNRIFGPEKPFGTIKYYRRPHTMENAIEEAFKLYSGDRPFGIFVDHLNKNIETINHVYKEIEEVFRQAGINDFGKLPKEKEERAKFVKLFNELNRTLEAAKIQGFEWDKTTCEFEDGQTLDCLLDNHTYNSLVSRYKELRSGGGGGEPGDDDCPYDLEGYITNIDTSDIDADYMNSRFQKFLKILFLEGADSKALKEAEENLHQTFATLTQEEQKIANILLHDIQSGDFVPEEGKTLRDYITVEQENQENAKIQNVADALGVNFDLLKEMKTTRLTPENLNEFGRFDALMRSIDMKKAKAFFEEQEKCKLIPPKVKIKSDAFLRDFLLTK